MSAGASPQRKAQEMSTTVVDEARVELSFTTTASDYMALLEHHLQRSVLGKRFALFAWAAIAALAWMSVILPYLKFGLIDAGFILRAALATALTFGFPFFYRRYNAGVFGQLINEGTVKGLAGPTSMVATKEFIEQHTPTTTARAMWRDVSGIASTKDYDFIALAPLVTVMIPASAFPNAESRREVQEKLHRWRDAAQRND
jgi:hypothetical protein